MAGRTAELAQQYTDAKLAYRLSPNGCDDELDAVVRQIAATASAIAWAAAGEKSNCAPRPPDYKLADRLMGSEAETQGRNNG